MFIIYHQPEHLKVCLDPVANMNETLNTVPGNNADADIDLGYEKKFIMGLVIIIMRACIYLLFLLYLRNLLFP